ncbi:MAG: AAA family ATPase [Oscillospiraceae bacterium]|nr:AAA family ATPase [Oscillospiraceae bacterium]
MDFTEKRQFTLNKFAELAQSCGSANKAAELIGVSASVMSSIKSNTYKGNYENVFNKVYAYFETKIAAQNTYAEVDYVPTSISQAVYEAIRACQIKGGFTVATGDAGIGKTKAVMQFAKDYPNNCAVITINPCCKSTRAVLKLIAAELGISIERGMDDLWLAIVQKLHDGMVIIVDEAQLLPYHSIETLRSFADYFDRKGQTMGVALVGNNGIREKIEGKSKEVYRQVNNRIWQRPFFKTKDVKQEDISLLFPLLKGQEKELTFLHKIAQTNEGIRGAVRLFANAFDNRCFDLAGLSAMAKAMRMNLAGLERISLK